MPFYAEYPDLKKSTEKEIYDILPKYGLSESEITALLRLDPDKRQQSFKDIFFWKNMNDTNDALMDFNNYILQNKIFLQTDLFQTFSIYQSKINSILTGFSIGKKDDPGFMRVPIKECRELLDEGTGELELLVQKRLHVQEASDF